MGLRPPNCRTVASVLLFEQRPTIRGTFPRRKDPNDDGPTWRFGAHAVERRAELLANIQRPKIMASAPYVRAVKRDPAQSRQQARREGNRMKGVN